MAGKGDIKKADIQPNLNSRWNTVEFEKVLEKTTITHKLKSSDFFNKGIFPVVDQGSNLVSGYVNEEEVLYKGKLPVVVFGDHTRNIKFIDFDFAVGADGTKILKSKKGIDVKFLYYYLKSLNMPDFGYSRHYSIFKFLDFPLPPLAEQERIVAKLDVLFDQHKAMKTAFERIPQLVKEFRQKVLTKAITGKLTENWRKDKLLEEWKKAPLKDVCLGFKYGSSSKSDDEGKVAVLRMGNLQNGILDLTNLKFSNDDSEIKKYTLVKGDVLFNRTNSPELVGKTSIYNGEIPAIYAGYLIKIENKKDLLNSDYLNYFMNSTMVRAWCRDIKSDGVSQSNINAQKLAALIINLPPLAEQLEIVRLINSFFTKADLIEVLYTQLKTKINSLPHAILHKAFKGQLVEQLSTDGDACDLLKEINFNYKK